MQDLESIGYKVK